MRSFTGQMASTINNLRARLGATYALGDALATTVEAMPHHYECVAMTAQPPDETICVCFKQAPSRAARAWRAAREA